MLKNLKEINTLSSKAPLNCLKVPIKIFIMLEKISISNKCCSFELSIHLWILKNKCITVSTKILCSTTDFNIIIRDAPIPLFPVLARYRYFYFLVLADTEYRYDIFIAFVNFLNIGYRNQKSMYNVNWLTSFIK